MSREDGCVSSIYSEAHQVHETRASPAAGGTYGIAHDELGDPGACSSSYKSHTGTCQIALLPYQQLEARPNQQADRSSYGPLMIEGSERGE